MYLKDQTEVVVYHPPKSHSHGHHSRMRGGHRAWAAIQHFLLAHTAHSLNSKITLTCHGPSKYTDIAISEQAAADAEALTGFRPTVSGEFRTWSLSEAQLPALLEFAFGWGDYPKQPIDPLSCYLSYSFEWLALPCQIPMPFQPNDPSVPVRSSLGISIWGRSVFLQPTFVFDLSAESPALKAFLNSIEQDVPFTMRDDFFKSIVPTVSVQGEKAIKLKKGWRNAA